MVELRMEPDLVLLAAGHEQDVCVLGGQQRRDGVFSPQLAAVRKHLAPAFVGVDGLVPAGGQLAHDGGLPGGRHARQQDALHTCEPTKARSAAGPRCGRSAERANGGMRVHLVHAH